MRRSALLLYVIASLSLLTAPFRDVHAHVDVDHDQILVHGGHDHEFDHHAALDTNHHDDAHDANHLAVHHDSHEGWSHSQHDDHERSDGVTSPSLIQTPHHVHVVSVASAEFDIGKKRWSPSITATIFRFADPPDRPLARLEYPPVQDRLFQPRFYLHPPLRGPPPALR